MPNCSYKGRTCHLVWLFLRFPRSEIRHQQHFVFSSHSLVRSSRSNKLPSGLKYLMPQKFSWLEWRQVWGCPASQCCIFDPWVYSVEERTLYPVLYQCQKRVVSFLKSCWQSYPCFCFLCSCCSCVWTVCKHTVYLQVSGLLTWPKLGFKQHLFMDSHHFKLTQPGWIVRKRYIWLCNLLLL